MPVLRTKRMPVNALRLSIGLRPGNRKRRGLGGGSRGSIRSQSSSGNRGLAMGVLLLIRHLFYVGGSTLDRPFVRVSKRSVAVRPCADLAPALPLLHALMLAGLAALPPSP